MSGIEPPPPVTSAGNPLIDRAKNILLTPKAEWERIAAEPATIQSLYIPYALILAAIGPVASAIAFMAFVPGINVLSALVGAVLNYGLALVSVGVLAIIIELLAPQFGAQKDRVSAFKVAIYGSTAAWLAGIFSLHLILAILGIVGLYSVYLIYLGLGPVMRTPADKQVVYTVVIVVVAIVLAIVVSVIVGAVARMGAVAPNALAPGQMVFPPPQQQPVAPGQTAPQPFPPQQYPQQPQPPVGTYSQSGYQYQPPQQQPQQPQYPPQGYQYPPQQPYPQQQPQQYPQQPQPYQQ